ncbi:MAG: excinuclease ABC subunit UvrC [Rhodoplanes sp.]|uniref:excinuclease ABC subunit UvrC n=1 Tax=Rhodoplanes sp. TaxID=1968906 RepID=UPI0018365FA2|nr:excinuclease ABC subunit UvrC [Rhodoplanes sp.]NVO15938.1 excinuclease ABC subunit UvrC [Rhodoplanes sp.]
MPKSNQTIDPELEPADDEDAGLPDLPEADAETDLSAAEGGTLASGRAVIAHHAKLAPAAPGVYRMIGAGGEVLYVGKAKDIRRRVTSYARPTGHVTRIARMIAATVALEFVSTATETEALLLEANLIKRLRPRFNVLLRDDKSFPYILITADGLPAQIAKHRGARNKAGDYFGPFAAVNAVNRTITALQRAFLLRSCADAVYESRTRPCLLHQIKRCAAPCTGEISHGDYAVLVGEAKAFLSGKSRAVKEDLAHEMDAAAAELDFERAAVLRDRLAALAAIQSHQGINPRGVEEADVFAIHQEGGYSCVEVFFFRAGQNWGNRAYFPKADRTLSPEVVLAAFLAQFYDDKPVPRLLLLSHDIEEGRLLADALSLKAERRIEVAVPRRGEKKELVDHAAANAREALGRKLADTASQQRLLEALAATFGLPRPPRRVEIYDNSHIQGSNPVGVMVVAGPEGFRKSQYRKFNIRSADLQPGDDYGMMREVLERRFKRLLGEGVAVDAAGDVQVDAPKSPPPPTPPRHSLARTGGGEPQLLAPSTPPDTRTPPDTSPSGSPPPASEARGGEGSGVGGSSDSIPAETPPLSTADPAPAPDPDTEPAESPWPDLVLIDGGPGQLAAATATLAALGITDVPLVAIAKGPDRDAGREHFHMAGREPFRLPPRDPVLYFVERLRDEAHRFAIGSHRARRKRDIREAGLQEIPGVGPARKRALLRHFGTLKAIERASLADLAHVSGVSDETARRIHDFFHDSSGRG